jgi:uncharacterized RDD family membrane protein YckC
MSCLFPPCYVAPMTAPTSRKAEDQDWPGRRLGLPRSGPGAVGGWGRRVLAIFVDWVLSALVVSVITGRAVWSPPEGSAQWYPLAVFAIEVTVLTLTLGGSAGQLVTRLQVRRLDGGGLDLWRAAVRTVLICLVIPPVIYNRDQRGLHDLVADSVVVRR